MKKVRLSLPRGVKSWSLVLYDSPESAYLLKDDVENIVEVDEVYRKVVSLSRGEFIEAEWMGAEWVYIDDPDEGPAAAESAFEKFDRVRFVKSRSTKLYSGDSTHYLEAHTGWVITGSIPWTASTPHASLKITEIKGRNKPKVDFSHIFQNDEDYDGEGDEEVSQNSDSSTYIN